VIVFEVPNIKEETRTFPRLTTIKNEGIFYILSSDGIIGDGFCIKALCEEYEGTEGKYYVDWPMEVFEDYDGALTIQND